MKEAVIRKINTTIGSRYLVVTLANSREFKTEKGAKRWCAKNGYRIK